MIQSKLGSLVEAWTNVVIGWSINFTVNWLVFPLFGWTISAGQNILLGVIYTAISLTRSYLIRRWFNQRIRQFSINLASKME